MAAIVYFEGRMLRSLCGYKTDAIIVVAYIALYL